MPQDTQGRYVEGADAPAGAQLASAARVASGTGTAFDTEAYQSLSASFQVTAATGAAQVVRDGIVRNGDATIEIPTTGIVAGMGVSGTGIPGATTVASVTDANELELSGAANASTVTAVTPSAVKAAFTTNGSAAVTVEDNTALVAGMAVTGTGIPGATTVSAVDQDGVTVTLSAQATATSSTNVTPSTVEECATTQNQATVTMASTARIKVGMTCVGAGIPDATTVTNVDVDGVTITLSAQATVTDPSVQLTFTGAAVAGVLRSGDTTVDIVTTSFLAGQTLTGTGIPNGTTVASVTDGTHLEMSAAATASTTVQLTFTGAAVDMITRSGDATLEGVTTNFRAGQTLSGTGIPGATTVASVTDGTHLEMSAEATATTDTELTFAPVAKTLDLVLETTADGGATWYTVGTFAQQTAAMGAALAREFGPLGNQCRWKWTIAGSSPSFTFAVAATLER